VGSAVGRLFTFLKDLGELDNTLIMVISDNGASSEGGPTGMVNEALFFNNVPGSLEENLAALDKLGGPEFCNHYAWGWTWAGNTPFRRWKRETYRGGISDPFIVHWPKGIKAKGEVRHQYAHAIDMVPTVLEALNIEPPASIKGATQSPIEGLSLAHTFDDGKAPTRHLTQYFEMMGHRSIYHDGLACGLPVAGPVVHRGRRVLWCTDRRRQAHRARRHGLGALPRGGGLGRERQPRGEEPGEAHRDDRSLVRRSREVQRHAGRFAGDGAVR